MEKTVNVGDVVIAIDEHGNKHNALVTAVWGTVNVINGPDGKQVTAYPCINVVFVSADVDKTDPYGRQLERLASCSHFGTTTAPGRYWYIPEVA